MENSDDESSSIVVMDTDNSDDVDISDHPIDVSSSSEDEAPPVTVLATSPEELSLFRQFHDFVKQQPGIEPNAPPFNPLFIDFFHGLYHLINPMEHLSKDVLVNQLHQEHSSFLHHAPAFSPGKTLNVTHQVWWFMRTRVQVDIYQRTIQKVSLIYRGNDQSSRARVEPDIILEESLTEGRSYRRFRKTFIQLLKWLDDKRVIEAIDMNFYNVIKNSRETPYIDRDEKKMRFVSMFQNIWQGASRMETIGLLALAHVDSGLSPASRMLFNSFEYGFTRPLLHQAWWFIRGRFTSATLDEVLNAIEQNKAQIKKQFNGDVLLHAERYPFAIDTDDSPPDGGNILLSESVHELLYYDRLKQLLMKYNPWLSELKPIDYNYADKNNLTSLNDIRNFERTETFIATMQEIWPYFLHDKLVPSHDILVAQFQTVYEEAINSRHGDSINPIGRDVEQEGFGLFDQAWLILRTNVTVDKFADGLGSLTARRENIKRKQLEWVDEKKKMARLRSRNNTTEKYVILLTDYISQKTILPAAHVMRALLASQQSHKVAWSAVIEALLVRDFPIYGETTEHSNRSIVSMHARWYADPGYIGLVLKYEYFKRWISAAVSDAKQTIDDNHSRQEWEHHIYMLAHDAIVNTPPSLLGQTQLSWFYRIISNRIAYFFMLARFFGWGDIEIRARDGQRVLTITPKPDGRNVVKFGESDLSRIAARRWFSIMDRLRDELATASIDDFRTSLLAHNNYMTPEALHFQSIVQDILTHVDAGVVIVFNLKGQTRYVMPEGHTPNVLLMGLQYGLSARFHHKPDNRLVTALAQGVVHTQDHVSAFYLIGSDTDVF
jgi:hypothetical protein